MHDPGAGGEDVEGDATASHMGVRGEQACRSELATIQGSSDSSGKRRFLEKKFRRLKGISNRDKSIATQGWRRSSQSWRLSGEGSCNPPPLRAHISDHAGGNHAN